MSTFCLESRIQIEREKRRQAVVSSDVEGERHRPAGLA